MARTPTPLSRRPHFFKVLLHGFSKRIRIPPAFIKHIEDEPEPRRAMILSPLGRMFQVDIERDMEDLYFGAGWQQFVHDHDLEFGYFLVFRYEDLLVFRVWVFDLTGCQKEYTPSMETDEISPRDARSHSGDSSHSTVKERITKRPVARSHKEAPEVTRMRSRPEVLKKKRTIHMSHVLEKKVASGTVTTCGKSSSFKTVMMSSNLTRCVNVPKAFKTANKMLRRQSQMTLRDPNGRRWTVGLSHFKNRSVLGRGWKTFSEHNNLKLGDECTFELLSGEKGQLHIFQVHINSRRL